METRKNLCAMLPVALHTRVRQEQEKAGMTLGEYVEAMITEYYDWKDGKIMTGEMRTLAAQIPAELFDRLDRYLKERGIKKNDPREPNWNKLGTYDYQTAKWKPKTPPKQTDPDIVYMTQPYSLNYPSGIIYSDDVSVPEIIISENDGPNIKRVHNGRIARFKRKNWSFQKEFRYIVTLQRQHKEIALKPYYDADLSNAAISNMQIVVSPMFSAGNYLLLDALLKKYDYGIKFSDSELKGKIKLK